ncbi:MAG: hypothetical protein ACYTGQ_11100 [Planctomycetota bacterium]|jgi:hypothetical protein
MKNSVEARLVALERRVNRYRLALLAVVTLMGLSLLVGQGVGGALREVRARKFVVVNDAGRPVVEMMSSDGAGGLMLYSATGKPVVVVGTTPDGGAVAVLNNDSQIMTNLYCKPDGGRMDLRFNSTRPAVVLGCDEVMGGGYVQTMRQNGKQATLQASTGSGGGFLASNDEGNPLATLGINEYGGMVELLNQRGRPMLKAGTTEIGGSLTVHNRRGINVVSAGPAIRGHGAVVVTDREGKHPDALIPVGEREDDDDDDDDDDEGREIGGEHLEGGEHREGGERR